MYTSNVQLGYSYLPEGVVEGSVDIGECWIVEEFTGSFPVDEIRPHIYNDNCVNYPTLPLNTQDNCPSSLPYLFIMQQQKVQKIKLSLGLRW